MTTITRAIPTVRGRFTLPPLAAFAGISLAFAAFYVAAGAPTPLFVLFQQEWGFPAPLLTIAFAVYAIALLAALIVTGSLSDHIGRRPVLIGSLVVELAAMVMFVFAPSIGWVIAARIVQGLATGAATSALTAAVVELAPPKYRRLGSIIGGTAAAGGLALGALLTGFAVQFTTHADVIVFTSLAIIMVLGTLVAVFSPETVSPRAGAVASLVPRVAIPRPARGEFAAALPALVAAWMIAGLFMGLVPTIIREVFHLDSGLLNGATAFLEPGAAAVAGFLLGRFAPRRVMLAGSAAVAVGGAIIVIGVAFGLLPLLWVGGVIGGVGFGASFSGTLRIVGPLAEAHQRAGLFAAVFLVSYLAFGVPTIIAGQLVAPFGLVPVIVGYGVAILLAAAVGVVAQLRASR